MTDYASALAAYLKDANQAELAEKVGATQASISRYKGSDKVSPRLPPREIAIKIDEATNGQVPFSLWIAAATKKFGLAA